MRQGNEMRGEGNNKKEEKNHNRVHGLRNDRLEKAPRYEQEKKFKSGKKRPFGQVKSVCSWKTRSKDGSQGRSMYRRLKTGTKITALSKITPYQVKRNSQR
jgi:hypothetical protein